MYHIKLKKKENKEKGNKPVVRLEVLPEARSTRKIGNAKNLIRSMADDFDEPLNDFKEYME